MAIKLDGFRTELEGFVSSCVFLVALCRTLIERIENRSSAEKKYFITLGPTVFLKEKSLYNAAT
jgi:hypothetical protein